MRVAYSLVDFKSILNYLHTRLQGMSWLTCSSFFLITNLNESNALVGFAVFKRWIDIVDKYLWNFAMISMLLI